MPGYLYLAIAIAAEVVATTSMKAIDGFNKPLPLLLVIGVVPRGIGHDSFLEGGAPVRPSGRRLRRYRGSTRKVWVSVWLAPAGSVITSGPALAASRQT